MYQSKKRDAADPKAPYLPGYSGVFEQTFLVGGTQRRMLTFIPENIRESTAGVLVLGENGATADVLLENSGWCELAEQEECTEKLIVCFLEPLKGVWNTSEAYGEPFGDVAYIDAAAEASMNQSCI